MITDRKHTYSEMPPWVEYNRLLARGAPAHIADARRETASTLDDGDRVEAVYGAHYAAPDVLAQARTVCEIAATILRAPHSQVALVDNRYQSQVTSYHVAEGRHRRSGNIECTDGLCQYVVGLEVPLVVSDATQHKLVCDTKQVTQHGVMSYLGVPVESADSHIIGTLCVWDARTRDWDVSDVDLLARLARMLTRADAMSQKVPPV